MNCRWLAAHGATLLAILLLAMGFTALTLSYYPRRTEVLHSPIIIWFGPTDRVVNSKAQITADLGSRQSIGLLYSFTAKETSGLYRLDFWIPYRVDWLTAHLYNSTGTISNMTKRFKDSSTWVNFNATVNAGSQPEIGVELGVYPLFSEGEPGKSTALITFWGGVGWDQESVDLSNKLSRVNSSEIFRQVSQFSFLARLPNDTILSADTFPPPTQLYEVGEWRWGEWVLNFSYPLHNYGQTISVTIADPTALFFRDLELLSGGFMLSTGAGIGAEVARDRFRSRNRVDTCLEEP